jgi:ribonuclease P protein component
MEEAYPTVGAPSGLGLPSTSRITSARDIRALLGRGRRRKTSHLDVFLLSSGAGVPRVGFIVPKHGQRAVDRNRVKRRLREVARRELLPRLKKAERPWDVLIRARRGAYRVGYQQLRRDLMDVCEELWQG